MCYFLCPLLLTCGTHRSRRVCHLLPHLSSVTQRKGKLVSLESLVMNACLGGGGEETAASQVLLEDLIYRAEESQTFVKHQAKRGSILSRREVTGAAPGSAHWPPGGAAPYRRTNPSLLVSHKGSVRQESDKCPLQTLQSLSADSV